jgi:hypothetical protein
MPVALPIPGGESFDSAFWCYLEIVTYFLPTVSRGCSFWALRPDFEDLDVGWELENSDPLYIYKRIQTRGVVYIRTKERNIGSQALGAVHNVGSSHIDTYLAVMR